MKVLYVEDNEINRIVVGEMLNALGFDMVEAPEGHSGLRAIQAAQFGMVLLDLHMPVMDGFEVLRDIRARTDSKRLLPVIVITADTDPATAAACLAAGADAVLHKPVRMTELCAATGAALTRRAVFGSVHTRRSCDPVACARDFDLRQCTGSEELAERGRCIGRLARQTVVPLVEDEAAA